MGDGDADAGGNGDAIQILGERDHDDLTQLWQRAGLQSLRPAGRDGREAFTAQLRTGVQQVFGIRRDDRLVAAVLATHDSRKGWINRLVVDPDCRGQGLAKRLIATAETWLQAQAQGIRVIAALIESWNRDSLNLFQGAGYYLHDDVVYLTKRDSPEA